jgi:ribosomal protein S18 acetylase RimI-like enzyme
MITIPFNEEFIKLHIDEFILIDKLVGSFPWGEKEFLFPLQNKSDLSFFVTHRNHLIGYIICSSYRGNKVHIHRLAIKSEYQNMMVGTKLLERIIKLSKKMKIHSITTETISKPDFYLKNGFRKLNQNEKKIYEMSRNKFTTNIVLEYDII